MYDVNEDGLADLIVGQGHAYGLHWWEQRKKSIYERPVIIQRWSILEQAQLYVDAVKNRKRLISPCSDAVKDLEIAEDYVKKLWRKTD